MQYYHKPIMIKEVLNYLNVKEEGIYVDATLGGAGHFQEILKKAGEKGLVIGIDRDIESIENAKEKFKDNKNAIFVHDNFKNLKGILKDLNISSIDGILYDLGVSSYQLDKEERGFSYQKDAPLDMRMDTRQKLTARDVVNTYDKEELKRIIYEYGEERFAGRIANFIVERRKNKPIETTLELVEVIKDAIPAKARRKGPHPAKRTFQALRIFVNEELVGLEQAFKDAISLLKDGGRIVVISFHSLEDRIVKRLFNEFKKEGGLTYKLRILTSKPVVPEEEEIIGNPRARSAKLRAAEKFDVLK
ncbi:16S rRNA (cytosine(1402)-N(4))-methyltransferase RsmH [Thermovenabulum gondwanense]|uniref:Ribosomal RNA small subunit methyltransferase H n=1 Tax=Thermovenabulum gondwanense TaxID=520767 RepID=A0A162MLX2_9FIRM|nr:16S rRNA (cytosine(1402)-N(4))-methyltransferase RsmH [Thermovenabulum gondwanense]KYO66673.1 Ribosomal RNA small subunit methyltransferase H [Thermovenabulum gondwanense]